MRLKLQELQKKKRLYPKNQSRDTWEEWLGRLQGNPISSRPLWHRGDSSICCQKILLKDTPT